MTVSQSRLLALPFIIGILVLSVYTPNAGTRPVDEIAFDVKGVDKTTVAYTVHESISITTDSDFLIQGWPGLGTPESPFVIENLDITTALNCILIANTTKHVVIRNCFLSATSTVWGEGVIRLDNVTNARIVNNHINGYHSAISVFDSSDCGFTDNFINTERFGLYAFNLSKSFFAHNNQTNQKMRYAIHVQGAQHLTVRNNDFHSVVSEGIRLVGGYDCIIEDNRFRCAGATYLGHAGALLLESEECHFARNVLSGFDTNLYILNGFNNWVNNNTFVQSRRGILLRTTSTTVSKNRIETTQNGIEMGWSNSCVLESNDIQSYLLHGIEARAGNGSLFRWNEIHDSEIGILLQGGMNDRIIENYVNDCVTGVSLEEYPGMSYEMIMEQGQYEWGAPIKGTVANNSFLECGVTLSINYPDGFDQVIEGNRINGGLLGYFYNWSTKVIDGDSYRQIILARCSDMTVVGGNLRGITMIFCTNIDIRNVNISQTEVGIFIDRSEGCLVSNSDILNNEIGVHIAESDSCYVYQSHIHHNNHGVYFYETSNSMVYGCEIFLNSYAIVFTGTINGIIESNRVHTNLEGIFLLRSDNTMVGNNEVVYNNGTGILVNRLSDANMIFGNSFGWNGVNAVCTVADNSWDNGYGQGNRWHNYFNTPTYVIEGGAGCEDRFPSLLGDGPSIPFPTDDTNSTMEDPISLSPLQTIVAIGMIGGILVIAIGNYIMKRFPM
ncbi:MAG: right-handed parallel beta-helix repeat-containing protein [Candidatus Thorarchaeota archaeon]